MANTVLYVTGGPPGIDKVSHISYSISSRMLNVVDEELGEFSYRGFPIVIGSVIVEDSITATALVTAAIADAAFTVQDDTGEGTILIRNFQATNYKGAVTSGQEDGSVVGFSVGFHGQLGGTNYNAETAISYTT